MTNHWIDLQHCKTILVEGSNVAENHPMAYKWIRKAQENRATVIHVDPRFTRTSATADMYAPIRPGTDPALLNTMINYVLVHKLYHEDYITTHTNVLFLGNAAFDFKDGLFSGFDEEKHKYNTETWGYQLDGSRRPRVAASLDDPQCIFMRLKTFVSRYTPEVGESITGIPAAQIQQIAENHRQEPAGSHPVCTRDDPAHDGSTRHPGVHHPATPSRQRREARQRRQRAAKGAQRAGCVQHGRSQQLRARLS